MTPDLEHRFPSIARALGITIDELAGNETGRVDLTGDWWA